MEEKRSTWRGFATIGLLIFVAIPPVSAAAVPQNHSNHTEPAEDSACWNTTCLPRIVISAQRYEQSIQDVPIAVSAISGDELEERNVEGLMDIAAITPGMTMYEEGPGRSNINIRGISSTVGSSTVSISLDDIILTSFNLFQVDPDFYDLERVEVLRGPQGALYGEAAMGGAIRLLTNQPNLQDFTGRFRYGSYRAFGADQPIEPDGGSRLDGAVNLPLIPKRLAVRWVGSSIENGGYIHQPDRNASNVNWESREVDRLGAHAQLSDRLALSFLGAGYRTDYGALNKGNENYEQLGRTNTTSFDTMDAESVKLRYALDFADLMLIGALYERSFHSVQDGTYDVYRLLALDPTLKPVALPAYLSAVDSVPLVDDGVNHHRTFEARLCATDDSPWRWTIGYYQEDNIADFHPVWDVHVVGGISGQAALSPLAPVFTNGLGVAGSPQGLLLDADYFTYSHAQAGYFNVEYPLNKKLTTGLGARYHRQELQGTTNGVLLGTPITGDVNETFATWNPRAHLSYQLDETASRSGHIYLSAAKGFRSGGTNAHIDNATLSQQDHVQETFEPDELWTYELGGKFSFWHDRLVPQLAIYYNDWRNVQAATISSSGLVPYVTNVGDAAGYGADAILAIKLTQTLDLGLTAAWNDMAFTTQTPQKAAGDPMDYTPRQAYAASLSWRQPLNSRLNSLIRLDYSWRDRLFLTPTAGKTRRSDKVPWLNARASLQYMFKNNRSAEVAIYARNLNNFKGRLDPNFFSDSTDTSMVQARARPRSIGAELQVEF